jgi:hypothetical protein
MRQVIAARQAAANKKDVSHRYWYFTGTCELVVLVPWDPVMGTIAHTATVARLGVAQVLKNKTFTAEVEGICSGFFPGSRSLWCLLPRRRRVRRAQHCRGRQGCESSQNKESGRLSQQRLHRAESGGIAMNTAAEAQSGLAEAVKGQSRPK